jgi:murein DD-endopeptidase MepM/ murein hydrolase activator NlpD
MAYARIHVRIGLGATTVETPAPVPGRPQPPIYPLIVTSAWNKVRSSPADGSCGVSGYPCRHPGVDVAGRAGTPVVAPEDGTVELVADGQSPPFTGYGPWLVILRGLASGKYHLLAHLAPATAHMAPQGAKVRAGQQVGTTSPANHTHWEIRTRPVPDFARGETNFTNNSDPVAWLSTAALGLGSVLLVGGVAALVMLLRRRS